MTIEQLSKEEFFHIPTRIGEFKLGRQPKYVGSSNRRTQVKSIEDSTDDQLIILPHEAVIDYGRPPAFNHGQNFLKRGLEAHVRVPRSMSYAEELELTPRDAFADAVSRIDPGKNYSGFAWRAPRDRKKRKVRIDDVLAAGKLFAFAEHSQNGDDKIEVKPYDSVWTASDIGAVYSVGVPSRTSDDRHNFHVSSVPKVGSDQYGVWPNFDFDHICNDQTHRFTFRDFPHQRTADEHVIAGVYKIAQTESRDNGRPPLQPFPVPSEDLVQYWNKLRHNVLIKHKRLDKSKGRDVYNARPLNAGEREALLMSKIGYDGMSTLIPDGKIMDYSWK